MALNIFSNLIKKDLIVKLNEMFETYGLKSGLFFFRSDLK